jgi:hypothetical protein
MPNRYGHISSWFPIASATLIAVSYGSGREWMLRTEVTVERTQKLMETPKEAT